MEAETRADGIKTETVRMAIDDLKLLKVNARFMRHETFTQLVENIRRDGALTSVPFAWKDEDGRYLVLSGNHRVMAAKEAGLTEIDVMLTDAPLSPTQRRAIQLSHNALVGEDDPMVLKQIYEEIEEVDWKQYAGLDDKTLELLEKISLDSLGEVNLSFQTITITFLPQELVKAKEAWVKAKQVIMGDEAWLARWSEYNKFLDGLSTAGDAFHVKNVATQLALLLEVLDRHITELKEGWLDDSEEIKHKGWVPLSTILGTDRVPAEAAKIINKAVNAMKDKGDITGKNLWQAIEYWAAEYLS